MTFIDTKNYCTMYIVRHGETKWNVEKRIQGHSDSKLTDRGLEQAQTIAKKFKSITFDAAFSSDLLRAKHTAEIIALEHKLIVSTTEALRERFFGKLEGVHSRDYQNEMKFIFNDYINEQEKTLIARKVNKDLINAVESTDAVVSRFITFLREIAIVHPNKTILIVCHGGIMMHFIKHLGYITNPRVENTAYMKLVSDGIDFFIKESEGITEWKGNF